MSTPETTKKLTPEIHTAAMKKLKKGSQNYRTYALLLRGEKLTTAKAFDLGLGMRLPNRINKLRDLDIPIESRVIDPVGNIKEYWISKENLEMFR